MGREQIKQRRATGRVVKPRHRVQCVGIGGQAMRLAVLDHLQAVFDGPVKAVGVGKHRRGFGIDPPRLCQRGDTPQGVGYPQRRIATAVDQLVDLDEKLDLADAAAPTLQVVTGAECLTACMMRTDAPRHRAQLFHRAKIDTAPPDEGLDRFEERLAHRDIARRRPRADEGCPFPAQRTRLIVGNRRIDRHRQRRRLRRGPQPQIDAQDIAIGIARLQQIDDSARNPNGRFPHIITFVAGHCRGIEQQDRINVRAIIQLAAAMFAERNCEKPSRIGIGHTHPEGFGDGGVERMVGKIGQMPDHRFERKMPRQIANRDHQRECIALSPKRLAHIIALRRPRRRQRRIDCARAQHVGQCRMPRHRSRQERCIPSGSIHRILKGNRCHLRQPTRCPDVTEIWQRSIILPPRLWRRIRMKLPCHIAVTESRGLCR